MIQYDDQGKIVLNEEGEKISYSYTDRLQFSHDIAGAFSPDNIPGLRGPNHPAGLNPCDPIWQYAIMGTSIGRKSLHASDIDGDGMVEVICSAQPGGFYGGYWGYWYVLQYDEVNQEYEQEWVSPLYNSYIRRITLADIDGDDILEILIGFDNGDVLIYNSSEKELIGQFNIPSGETVYDIQVGDADNDNRLDIAVCDENNIYIIDPSDFILVSTIGYGCVEFRIGNVDEDPELEIVITGGKVLEYDGTNTIVEWVYDTSSGYGQMLELSDIDNDGMKEIIRARSWDYIDVYDADIQALKYDIESDLDIQALLLKDVNNDNTDEILYGDGQWGEVHCINAVTQAEMWKVDNPDHGVTGIAVADVDNDGTLEVMWGAGWTSTGGDYFYIASVVSQQIEWQSVALDGPFYAVEIGDVDNDGTPEIVAVSYESDSGYESGIISVFNAQTHELEWQSDGHFLYLVWTGIFDVALNDIDQDGVVEIIIAAGQAYTGEIWIIDGITKEIESSHIFSQDDISEFFVLSVEDVDDDGTMEIVAGNNTKAYVINPSDFSVEWETAALTGYGPPKKLLTGNTDTDQEIEIVICKGYIYVIDGKSHQQWQTSDNNYTSADLFDLNEDGILEIVAGDNNGYLTTFDGSSHQVIDHIKVCSEEISGIQVARLNEGSSPEFVFTSDGMVFFYSDTNAWQNTQRFGAIAGAYNGLKVYDANNDGEMEVYVGSTVKVIQLGSSCYECLWFNILPDISSASCGIDDGSIELNASGGVEPYAYQWSTGSTEPALYDLPAGDYVVTVTDNMGCEITETLTVPQAYLMTSSSSTNVSCGNTDDGTATVNVETGTPPYSFLWSTGDTTATISSLAIGNYAVTVEDAKHCISSENITIEKDTLTFYLIKSDIECFGQSNGFLEAHITEGTPPFTYEWSNGSTGQYIYNLAAGEYSVMITDAGGCSAMKSDSISQPSEMITQIITTADDPGTPFGEGTATINVYGGTPPYQISWNDPFQQTGVMAINLTTGMYIATVSDDNWCIKTDTAHVDSALSISEMFNRSYIRLYPNPTTGVAYLDIGMDGLNEFKVVVYDILGRGVFSETFTAREKSVICIDLSVFYPGLYCVSVVLGENRLHYYLELIK